MPKRLSLILLLLGVLGCSTEKGSEVESNHDLDIINIDPSSAKSVKLSDLYAQVDLIKLETNPKGLLGEITKLIATESFLYFVSNNALYVFDRRGDFKFNIKRPGKGPGEYLAISDAIVDEDSGCIIFYDSQSKKILTYSSRGDFIEDWDTGLHGFAFTKMDDASYALYTGSLASYRLNITSKLNGKIGEQFFKVKENESQFLHLGDLTNFSEHNGNVSFLYSFNDTIYTLQNDKVSPRMFVDFGEKKLPASFLENTYNDVRDFLETCKETNYAFRIIGFYESDGHIVFSFMYQKEIVHAYYEKGAKAMVVNEFKNDLLFDGLSVPASFDNLPKATFENEFYTIVNSYEFVSNIEAIKTEMSAEEWEDFTLKHPDVISLYQASRIDDNPIIMVGKIKKFSEPLTSINQ